MSAQAYLPSQINQWPVRAGTIVGWWTGGASWILKHPTGAILFIDLFLREQGSAGWVRRVPSPFSPSVMPSGSLLVTHEHGDHCDLTVLAELAQRKQIVILPPSAAIAYQDEGSLPDQWRIAQPGQIHRIGPWTVYVWDSGDSTAKSARMYTVQSENISIFHGGDSLEDQALFHDIGAQLAPTYALLSVGRPDRNQFYLSPKQATAAAASLQAVRWIPMHWELWSQSAMAGEELDRALRAQKAAPPWSLVRHGQPLVFSKDGADPQRPAHP